MSSWKDTVLSEQELDKLAKANPLLDFSFEDDYKTEVELLLEAQAEITWDKAIREVVEWAEPFLQNMGGRDGEPLMWIMISKRDWQAKLKEWNK